MGKPLFRNIPVVKRLYPSLLKSWAGLTWTGGYKIKQYEGLFFMLSYRNFVDRHIAFFGFERPQVNFLMSRMQGGCDCFIDIGANIGLYALKVAQADLAREIHAFEPDPRNYAQLMGNLYLNQMTARINCHPVALSSKAEKLAFNLSHDASTGRTRVARPGREPATAELQAVALDELLKPDAQKIFMKVDVEGHELDVFKGAEALLRRNDCCIQVEIWDENLSRVEAHLGGLGYERFHQINNDYYFARAKAR